MRHHEAVLALVVLVVVFGVLVRWKIGRRPDPRLEEDRSAPYREGLHAALRIQGAAQEMEQQLYAEANRQAENDPRGEP